MGFIKRKEVIPGFASEDGAFIVDPARDPAWAAVLEFLSSEKWPDGSRRQTGTVLLFVDEGRLKACLSDRAQGLVSFVTGSSFLDVLESCEGGLRADSLDWRKSRAAHRKGKGQ